MKKKNIISIALSVVFSVVFVAAAVNAATTIGTDIDTGGTLTANGLTTLGNASTTLFSAYGPAYFGATATSTFSSAGVLTLISPLGVGSGGTGLTSATAGYTLIGDSASALQATSTLFVSSTGYVGIGTSTPNNLLSVYQLIDFNNTDFNTKLGYQSGLNIVSGAKDNTFIGYQAGMASSTASTFTADDNTAVGYMSFYSNTTSTENAALGIYALYANTTGSYNTAIGGEALYSNTTGNYNTAVGAEALSNTTGANNIALGYQAGDSITTGSNNIIIGYTVDAPSATGSNQLNIGNTIYGNLTSGNVGIGTSTPAALLHLDSGASATTTIAIGDRLSGTGKTCFDVANSDGVATRMYVNGITLVIEAGTCN